ncbi:MAG: hypothetical protein GTN74_02725 [Proteobacteria bacterium]|nr:hypothetical protein [Pseudomonadota bacterium]NIS68090.1 hypothetical protein [Pseudomonadota bacterium]
MEISEVQDFAGEVQVSSAGRPRWITKLAYCLVLWGLGYFIWATSAGGLEGPNRVFWALLAFWLVYTPLAERKKWFTIRL